MLEPRAEAGCAILGKSIYIVGGYSWNTHKRLESVEVYDIEMDAWTSVASIAVPYTGVACGEITVYRTANDISHERL